MEGVEWSGAGGRGEGERKEMEKEMEGGREGQREGRKEGGWEGGVGEEKSRDERLRSVHRADRERLSASITLPFLLEKEPAGGSSNSFYSPRLPHPISVTSPPHPQPPHFYLFTVSSSTSTFCWQFDSAVEIRSREQSRE